MAGGSPALFAPAIALALLSAMEPARLAAAVDAGDVALLAKVKGVGKRTAERLCVELKDRLGVVAALPGAVTDRGASVAAASAGASVFGRPGLVPDRLQGVR